MVSFATRVADPRAPAGIRTQVPTFWRRPRLAIVFRNPRRCRLVRKKAWTRNIAGKGWTPTSDRSWARNDVVASEGAGCWSTRRVHEPTNDNTLLSQFKPMSLAMWCRLASARPAATSYHTHPDPSKKRPVRPWDLLTATGVNPRRTRRSCRLGACTGG